MATRKTTSGTTQRPVLSSENAAVAAGSDHAQDQQSPGPGGRGSVVDRRSGIDRRRAKEAADRASGKTPVDASGLERRRGPGRRLSDFTRAAEEGELTQEQFLFVMAIEAFKRANDKQFPTWCDVLEVIRLLGYRKTMPSELRLTSAEDWRESPISPANVRPPRWAEHGRVDAERADADRARKAA